MIKNEGFDMICNSFPNLTTLKVKTNQISNIKLITNLTNLTNLSIGSNKEISQKDVSEYLCKLKKLKKLNLDFCSISEENVQLICNNLTNLTKLYLRGNKLKNESIKFIKNLKQLKYLNLETNLFGNDSIEYLNELTKLQYLELGENDFTTEGVLKLKLTNLESFSIYSNDINDEGAKYISENLINLTDLCLRKTQLTLEGVEYLKSLKYLKELSLDPFLYDDDYEEDYIMESVDEYNQAYDEEYEEENEFG